MNWTTIETLQSEANKRVLDYLRDRSAHSDVADALIAAVKPLGDVQAFCPAPTQCRYLTMSTLGTVFAFAHGMKGVCFRLNPVLKDRALRTGAEDASDAGPEWVFFTLFRDDWPEFDLKFWARKAYAAIRGQE